MERDSGSKIDTCIKIVYISDYKINKKQIQKHQESFNFLFDQISNNLKMILKPMN